VAVFIPACHTDDGFDAWMRERTEAAHQAMMKHARRGGIPYA
jgi:methionine synthase II (cobalamin-independent)